MSELERDDIIGTPVADAEGAVTDDNTAVTNANGQSLGAISTVVDSEKAIDPVEKVTLKKRLSKLVHNAGFVKTRSIIMLCMKLTFPALCIIQMVLWGFAVKDNYTDFYNAIIHRDILNIFVMLMMVIFVVMLIFHSIKEIVYVIKKRNEIMFETVSTYLAFCFFRMFMLDVLASRDLVIDHFSCMPIIIIVAVVAVMYMVIRLFEGDFTARLAPMLFSIGIIALAIIMYVSRAGNFASFTFLNSYSAGIADFNLGRYIEVMMGNVDTGSVDATFIYMVSEMEAYALGMEFPLFFIAIPIQFLAVFVADVFPYAILSLIGYAFFGLMSKNYVQYMKIYHCQRLSILMLVITAISAVGTIYMSTIFSEPSAKITMSLDYTNLIITLVGYALLITFSCMPMKIYNIVYRRRYKRYTNPEGGKK